MSGDLVDSVLVVEEGEPERTLAMSSGKVLSATKVIMQPSAMARAR